MKKIWEATKSIVWYFILNGMIEFLVAISLIIISSKSNENFFELIANTIAILLTIYIYYRHFKKKNKSLVQICKVKSLNLNEILKISVLMVTISLFINIIYIVGIENLSGYTEVSNTLESWINTPLGIFNICILGPIFEEILCRGMIFNKLREYFKLPISLIVQALIFAVMHGNLYQISYTFWMGIALGLVYLYTDSILGCILLHILNNTFSGLIYEPKSNLGIIATSIVGLIISILILINMYKNRRVKDLKQIKNINQQAI